MQSATINIRGWQPHPHKSNYVRCSFRQKFSSHTYIGTGETPVLFNLLQTWYLVPWQPYSYALAYCVHIPFQMLCSIKVKTFLFIMLISFQIFLSESSDIALYTSDPQIYNKSDKKFLHLFSVVSIGCEYFTFGDKTKSPKCFKISI